MRRGVRQRERYKKTEVIISEEDKEMKREQQTLTE